jgi:hypothetical protein
MGMLPFCAFTPDPSIHPPCGAARSGKHITDMVTYEKLFLEARESAVCAQPRNRLTLRRLQAEQRVEGCSPTILRK